MKRAIRITFGLAAATLAASLFVSGNHPRPKDIPDLPVPSQASLDSVKTVGGKPVTTVNQPGHSPAKAIAGQVVVKVSDPSAVARLGQAKPSGLPNTYLVAVNPTADLSAE